MNKWIIAIPTRNRYDMMDKGTLSNIPENLMEHVYLFVRDDEYEQYVPVVEKYGCGLINLLEEPINFMRDPEAGMAEVRDFIVRYCYENDIVNCIMIDDDIRFAVHELKAEKTTYHPMSKEEFHSMIMDLLEASSPELPLAGIQARQFSNNKLSKFEYNTRIIQLQALHIPTIISEGVTFTYEAPFISDYNFALELLTRGYRNIVLNKYTRDDKPNEKGGCSEYRTAELQSASAVALYKKFPDVVRLVQKTNGSWKTPRINPVVSWKKAYKEK